MADGKSMYKFFIEIIKYLYLYTGVSTLIFHIQDYSYSAYSTYRSTLFYILEYSYLPHAGELLFHIEENAAICGLNCGIFCCTSIVLL